MQNDVRSLKIWFPLWRQNPISSWWLLNKVYVRTLKWYTLPQNKIPSSGAEIRYFFLLTSQDAKMTYLPLNYGSPCGAKIWYFFSPTPQYSLCKNDVGSLWVRFPYEAPKTKYFFLPTIEYGMFEMMYTSDVIIPGHFYFPEYREFPGIQANFVGIPENTMKSVVSPDLEGI